MVHELRSEVAASRERVWAYYSAPGAMRRLSPPFLPLRPVAEADSLRDGTAVLEPSAPLPGALGRSIGPRWVARHEPSGFVEGERFVDRCVSEPYRTLTGWVHEHSFADSVTGGTVVGDAIRARVPGSTVARALTFRHRRLAADLAALERLPGAAPLTVAVTGAGGLVGTQLTALLGVAGHRVVRLRRGAPDGPQERTWDPDSPDADLLDGIDVLVHLAGASIAGRFTDAHVAAIRGSRIGPTERLARLVAARGGRTGLVCASAIGFYGPDRGDEVLDESAARGEGILADVVADWEAACDPARDAGARVVSVRTGVVLTSSGGMLGALGPVFASGVGGTVGDGRQWLSWISLDDLLDVYLRAVVDHSLEGAVNAVSPSPVRNRDLTRAVGRVLRRPTVVPVPAVVPVVLLGRDGARELALADQRVDPAVLRRRGHGFRHGVLESALRLEFGRQTRPGLV